MQEVYKQAIDMQHKLRDYIDDPSHSIVAQLKNEVQRLTDEIEVKKNPRSIEDRVKQIIRLLESAEETTAISRHHIDDLRDRCEDIRQDLRKLM
jgi:hypothetical protein